MRLHSRGIVRGQGSRTPGSRNQDGRHKQAVDPVCKSHCAPRPRSSPEPQARYVKTVLLPAILRIFRGDRGGFMRILQIPLNSLEPKLAKPNYNYQKKQKELARQAKQAQKRQKRQARSDDPETAESSDTGDSPPPATTPGTS